jgi:hypothetical protein
LDTSLERGPSPASGAAGLPAVWQHNLQADNCARHTAGPTNHANKFILENSINSGSVSKSYPFLAKPWQSCLSLGSTTRYYRFLAFIRGFYYPTASNKAIDSEK